MVMNVAPGLAADRAGRVPGLMGQMIVALARAMPARSLAS